MFHLGIFSIIIPKTKAVVKQLPKIKLLFNSFCSCPKIVQRKLTPVQFAEDSNLKFGTRKLWGHSDEYHEKEHKILVEKSWQRILSNKRIVVLAQSD